MPLSKTLLLMPACCILLSFVTVTFSMADQNAAPTDTGTVILHLRDPAGKPVQNRLVHVVSIRADPSDTVAVDSSAGTNAAGTLMLPLSPHVWRLRIFVRGVGFGATGTFEVLPNTSVSSSVPPLAPYGQVSGSVDSTLLRPGASVVAVRERSTGELMDKPSGNVWDRAEGTIDAHGRFQLNDLVPGRYALALKGGRYPQDDASERVEPGDHRDHIVIHPRPKHFLTLGSPQWKPFDTKEYHPKASGHVAMTDGQPVPGTIVYAVCIYSDPHGEVVGVRTATTDVSGAFHFSELPAYEYGMSMWLLAAPNGRTLALACAMCKPDDKPGTFNPEGDVAADLTVPSQKTEIAVRVLESEKPSADALVILKPRNGPRFSEFTNVEDGSRDLMETVKQFLAPRIRTDSNGVATFDNLMPGLWDITAVAGTEQDAMGIADNAMTPFVPNIPYGRCSGVSISAGTKSACTLSVFKQATDLSLFLLDSHGRPPTQKQIAVGAVDLGGQDPYLDEYLTFDGSGKSLYHFPSSGLWSIKTRFREAALNDLYPDREPFDEVGVTLAVSPLIDHLQPIVLKAAHHATGRIHVRLMNVDGKPTRGAVIIDDEEDRFFTAASTNQRGEVTFPDMPTGTYKIIANIIGRPRLPVFVGPIRRLPLDRLLSNRSALAPETVNFRADEPMDLVVKPHPVGYVVVPDSIGPAKGRYEYYVSPPMRQDFVGDFYVASLGRGFVCGPYLPGNIPFDVYQSSRKPPKGPFMESTLNVQVIGGRVIHPDFMQAGPYKPVSSVKTVTQTSASIGQVFLSDGKTPAWAACAGIYLPNEWGMQRLGLTDAAGTLMDVPFTEGAQSPVDQLSGSPSTPVVVAYLPGKCGAVIVPYQPGEPVRLVLPAPVSLRGRVTVGGQSVADLDSTFTILAAYQGKGKLNDLLSVEATAQADGTFDLSGLTPGVYHVQAARDGIWLSKTQTITVGDNDLPDVVFDIGLPGTAMILHFRDASGKPLVSQLVTLARPAGPLTDALWPKTLTTDGAGDLRIEGLEEGPQSITIQASDLSQAADPQMQIGHIIRFVLPDYSSGEQAVEKTVIVSGTPAND